MHGKVIEFENKPQLLNLESTTYLTDTLITNLPEGKFSVTLEMKGYVAEPFVQVVHVQRNQLSAVSFDLKPAPLVAQSQEPPKTSETHLPTIFPSSTSTNYQTRNGKKL